jgi:hypothetical protein
MRLSIEVPAGDSEIIGQLKALPGAQVVEEDRLDGAEIVRIILEIAGATGGIAAVAHNVASTVKSGASIVTSLRQIFRDGAKKYHADPNRRFAVYSNKRKLLSSDMSAQEVDDKLKELDQEG